MNTIVTNNKDKTISLNKNFIYNFVNQILLLIIPLITTPYLARVLGVDINGRIAFSSSITSYFILFASNDTAVGSIAFIASISSRIYRAIDAAFYRRGHQCDGSVGSHAAYVGEGASADSDSLRAGKHIDRCFCTGTIKIIK